MSDYISREAAIAYIREQSEELQKAFEELGGESGIYADAYNDLAEDFHRIPAADVEPVRHGRWISWEDADNCIPSPNRHECSVCHDAAQVLVNNIELLSNFCPNCGAKMDLEGENDD
nr:MAG TPA: zinc-ribbon containing domain protein [Caudoviricetes sp.]